MPNFDHILLFKTNISSLLDKYSLEPVLDNHRSIKQWTVDLNDCDFVLRIESDTLKHQDIINLMKDHGYECCELT